MADIKIFDRTKFASKEVEARTVSGEEKHDPREMLLELEKKGEVKLIHITDEHQAVTVENKSGLPKRIPTNKTWQHKSCGQCGNIPGYPASLYWFMNKFGKEYLDETNQSSCTAWNYHGSGTSNPVALAAVFVRNMHRAYETGYYPLIHCATSFGDYKEMRNLLAEYKDLRDDVRKIMKKIGRDLVIPIEVVHYSEWVHVMRNEIGKLRKYDCSNITATVHPACHTFKMIPEDYIYDKEVYGGVRPAPTTAVLLSLGANVADYSTWHDCCGFGFRHILTEREFTRSFAMHRKIKVMVEEAHSDVAVTQDTGCTTTLDKNQWVGKAHDLNYSLPVMADVQFAALACGADPYKIVQLQWHTAPWQKLCEKMGIDWQKSKKEYEDYLERIRQGGPIEMLYTPKERIMVHSSV